MDVIAATNAGFMESICTMGTALTESQALNLKKYSTQAIICYDADKAGIAASKKAINIFKKVGMGISLVLLPIGMDPDEFVKKYGPDAYVKYFDSHILNEYQYYFETAFLNKDLSDYTNIESIKYEIFQIIASLTSQTAKEAYLSRLAERLQASITSIISDYNTYCNINPSTQSVEISSDDINNSNNIEAVDVNNQFKKIYELRLLMYARSSREKAMWIDSRISNYLEGFSELNRSIWISLINHYYYQYAQFDDSLFCDLLTEDQRKKYLNNIEQIRNSTESYDDQDLEFCIEKLKEMDLKEKNRQLSKQIVTSLDEETIKKKLAEKFKNKKKLDQSRRK